MFTQYILSVIIIYTQGKLHKEKNMTDKKKKNDKKEEDKGKKKFDDKGRELDEDGIPWL